MPKRALTVEDLKDTKPEYISNITVNRWKRDETSEKNYDLLTVSPTSIERLDSKPGQDHFKGKLEPGDIKLSDAMATSAAALSMYMGKYDKSPEMGLSLNTLFGLDMGTRMISDIQSVRKETSIKKVWFFANIIFVRPSSSSVPSSSSSSSSSSFSSLLLPFCDFIRYCRLSLKLFVLFL